MLVCLYKELQYKQRVLVHTLRSSLTLYKIILSLHYDLKLNIVLVSVLNVWPFNNFINLNSRFTVAAILARFGQIMKWLIVYFLILTIMLLTYVTYVRFSALQQGHEISWPPQSSNVVGSIFHSSRELVLQGICTTRLVPCQISVEAWMSGVSYLLNESSSSILFMGAIKTVP